MRRRLLWLLALAASAARSEVIDVSQGTNLSLAVHPDQAFIAIDLLGGLWRLPVAGGAATPLIPAGSGVAQPRFDPSGERIVFQRWDDGQWDIWMLTVASGNVEPLTQTGFNEREPEFDADGREIVFAGDSAGRYHLWSLDPATGSMRQLTDEPGDARFPTLGPGGEMAYVHVGTDGSDVRLYQGSLRGRPLIESRRRIDAPSWRPGGDVLVVNERITGTASDLRLYIDADEPIWRQLTEDEDVFVGRPGWLSAEEYVYAADGAIWRRRIGSLERTRILMFAGVDVESVAEATAAPSVTGTGPVPVAGIGGRVRHEASGRAAFTALGDLWLIENDEVRRLTDDEFSDFGPEFSVDGEWLTFVSDRDGDFDLWRLRIANGQLLQLSDDPGMTFEARLSDDGSRLAFLETRDANRWGSAAVKLIDPERAFDVTTLDSGLVAASGLHWQGSYLRLDAADESSGKVYLHVYETDTAAADDPDALNGPDDRAIPDDPALSWQPATTDEPYVIQAGRMFDGVGNGYRYHVDIHVERQRIREITGRDVLPLPDKVIDLRDSTVIPGLIDVHAHLGTGGADQGRRWLRHGVTTVRIVGGDWRRAVERAETWASGHQPGPRLVVASAGAAIPAESPIIIGSDRSIFGGLAHALSEQWAREGRFAPLPDVNAGQDADHSRWFALSTLGRSYDDVYARMEASGAYLATGLGALDALLEDEQARGLASAYVRVMRRTGRVAIGSDAPAVPYGEGFHRELLRLADQGIPNDQILRLATAGGAIALGLSLDTGTLERGRLADLVVVSGDPLADLESLRRIDAVVVGGVWHDTGSP